MNECDTDRMVYSGQLASTFRFCRQFILHLIITRLISKGGKVDVEGSSLTAINHTMASSVGDGQQEQAHGYSAQFFECWHRYLGDHVHHGFYENPVQLENASALKNDLSSLPRDAAVRLIDELLRWAKITNDDLYRPRKILDVGCGVGGVSRYLATTFGPGTSVQGISLEKVEIEMAKKITAAANLSEKANFIVGDALELPFPDNAYELVWCMECADHIPDKQKLINELVRVTTPGGRIVLSTLCCPEEPLLSESDKEMARTISDHVTGPLTPISRYVGLAQEHGLEEIKIDNWSKYVIPGVRIWSLVFKDADVGDCELASSLGGYVEEFDILVKGYERGIVRYTVFTATKPSSSS